MKPTITNPTRIALLAGAAVLILAAPALRAQKYTPPPPPLTTAPCVPTKKELCDPPPAKPAATQPSADKFPFPGEPGDPSTAPAATTPAAKTFPFPGEPGDAPTPPAAPAATTPAAQKFPFPEDADKPPPPSAPTPAGQKFPFPGEPAEPASSSSSSSSSSNSDPDPIPDDKPALADKGSSGSTRAERRRHLPKVEDLDDREAKDLEVAQYYTSTGNFLAAYNRAKDAVTTIPDDPMAHFALAEGARNLKKNDEAIAEYKLYLKLDPAGEKVKAAQRALDQLAPAVNRK